MTRTRGKKPPPGPGPGGLSYWHDSQHFDHRQDRPRAKTADPPCHDDTTHTTAT